LTNFTFKNVLYGNYISCQNSTVVSSQTPYEWYIEEFTGTYQQVTIPVACKYLLTGTHRVSPDTLFNSFWTVGNAYGPTYIGNNNPVSVGAWPWPHAGLIKTRLITYRSYSILLLLSGSLPRPRTISPLVAVLPVHRCPRPLRLSQTARTTYLPKD
jgi:hypothetical protein